jgi:peptidoglycan-associated lipoprotein
MRPHRLTIVTVTIALLASTACRTRQDAPALTPAPPIVVEEPADPGIADRASADAKERAEREQLERERLERERLAAERMRSMTATIYFDLDRSDLTIDARSGLDAKLGILATVPAMRIRIAGHADDRGSDEYNIALAQRRAAAAKRYLVQRGIDAARIEIVSFGEEHPVCAETHERCWSQNRRDEFEITAAGTAAAASLLR